MYSDKIFPRPFPPVCQFFHPFLRLAPRLCPYFRRSSPFFLSAPPPPNPVLSFSPPHQLSGTVQAIAFPTFPYCAGVFFFALSYLPPPSLFSVLFPLPSLFSCPPPPDFPVLCRRCPVCHNFPVFFDEIDKKRGTSCYFSDNIKEGDNACGIVPRNQFLSCRFYQKILKAREKAKITLFAFSPCAAWAARRKRMNLAHSLTGEAPKMRQRRRKQRRGLSPEHCFLLIVTANRSRLVRRDLREQK